ncbi:MAG: hypothetical protein ACLTMP_08515 [Eggerthella lenta]
MIDQGNQQPCPHQQEGYDINFVTSFFGPKPTTPATACAGRRPKEGVRSPPRRAAGHGRRRQSDQRHREGQDGHVQFNASKGVIVAMRRLPERRGDAHYYQPDMTNRAQADEQDGDGHKMVVWAGGKIEDLAHTKMLHDFDAGPASMCDMPFLAVKMDGTRFVNRPWRCRF